MKLKTLLPVGTLILFVAFIAFSQNVSDLPAWQSLSSAQVVSVTTTPTNLFSATRPVPLGRSRLRIVQNVGTNAFLYLLNSTNVSSTNFHGVVAGGVAARDGLGGILNLSRSPFPVALVTETGTTTVSVVEVIQ